MAGDIQCLYQIIPIQACKTSQWSITTNFQSLIAHIYHVMMIMTREFSRISFLLLLSRNSFEQS